MPTALLPMVKKMRALLFAISFLTCMVGAFGQLPSVAALAPSMVTLGDTTGSASCTLPDGSQGRIFPTDGQPTCCPPNAGQSAQACLYAKYINPVIALLSVAIGLIVVIVLVYGAIEYITSGGDPQRAAAAKTRIMNALIALVAFILLYAFLKFILPGGSN